MRADVSELARSPVSQQRLHLFLRKVLAEPRRALAGQRLREILAARERVQGGQKRGLRVDRRLRRPRDPDRVRPELLEQEAEAEQLRLEGPGLGGQVLRQDRGYGMLQRDRRGLGVLPQPLVEDAFVGAVLVEDYEVLPLLRDERRPRCRLSRERVDVRPDGGHHP